MEEGIRGQLSAGDAFSALAEPAVRLGCERAVKRTGSDRLTGRPTIILNEEAYQMLSILAVAVYLSSLALIGYRVVKIRFAKYNKENMGLLGILALLSYTTIEPLLLSLFFAVASLVLLLLYITLWIRFSKRTR
jgi:hypothetical protein